MSTTIQTPADSRTPFVNDSPKVLRTGHRVPTQILPLEWQTLVAGWPRLEVRMACRRSLPSPDPRGFQVMVAAI